MSDSTDDRRAAGEGAANRPDEWDFSGPAAEAVRRNAASRADEASSWSEEDFARISASPRRIRRRDKRTPLVTRLRSAMPRVRLPRPRIPVIPIPEIHLPRVTLPRISMPRVTLPNVSMPRVALPRPRLPNVAFPRVRFPNFRLPSLRLPRLSVRVPQVAMPRLPRLSLAARFAALAAGARALLARQGARIAAAGGAVRDLALRCVFALLQGAIVLFFRALWPVADAAAGARRGAVAFAAALRDGGLKGLAAAGRLTEDAAKAALRHTARAGSAAAVAMFAGKGPQWRAGAFAAAGFCLFFIAARNTALDWQGSEAIAEAPSASAPVAVATAEHLFEAYRVPTPLARIPYTGTRQVAAAQAQAPASIDADLLPPRFNLPGTQRGRDYRATTAEAQVRLLRLGYAAGTPTGEQSPRTSRALALFQKSAGLPVTGEVDMATIERLRRASAS